MQSAASTDFSLTSTNDIGQTASKSISMNAKDGTYSITAGKNVNMNTGSSANLVAPNNIQIESSRKDTAITSKGNQMQVAGSSLQWRSNSDLGIKGGSYITFESRQKGVYVSGGDFSMTAASDGIFYTPSNFPFSAKVDATFQSLEGKVDVTTSGNIEYMASQNVRSTSNTNTNLKTLSSMVIKGQSKTSFKTITGDITINNPKDYVVSSSGSIAQTSGQNTQVTATAGKISIKSAKTTSMDLKAAVSMKASNNIIIDAKGGTVSHESSKMMAKESDVNIEMQSAASTDFSLTSTNDIGQTASKSISMNAKDGTYSITAGKNVNMNTGSSANLVAPNNIQIESSRKDTAITSKGNQMQV